jgi:hypothetical protein
MTEIVATAEAPMAWTFSKAGTQMRNAGAHGIRVTLQLAGQRDSEEHGLAGRLIASMGAVNANEAPYAIKALIHIDGAAGRPYLGEPTYPVRITLEILERLQLALDDAWQTARNVELLDEQGRPLLLGALNPHPAGVSRWLTQYCQDGR